MIRFSIDLNKIDKSKAKAHHNGCLYYEMVMIPRQSEYSDYMVVAGVSKEERLAGVKGAILGNGKNVIAQGAAPARNAGPSDRQMANQDDKPAESVPF